MTTPPAARRRSATVWPSRRRARREDPLADPLAGGLDRAAGHVGLPGGRRRAAGADRGVRRADHHPVHAQLGAADLLLDGDQALADLGRGGVHGHHRLAGGDLQPDPRGRVVVVALGEADVLVADRVADAAHHALAVGGVGHPAGQAAQVGAARGVAVPAPGLRQRHGLHAAQQLGHRRRAVHDLPGRRLAAHADRVAAAQLDRVHAQRRGQLVHLRLVAERGLHRAEAAHRAARRVVGVEAVAVDVHVRHHVRADAHGPGVADHGRRAGGVGPAVEVDLRLDVDQGAVAGRAVLVAHPGRVAVHVPEERLLAVVGHLDRLAGVQRQHARVHVHGQVLAAAERAADPGQHQPDLLRRQAERGADLPLVDVQPLGGHVQVDPAVRRPARPARPPGRGTPGPACRPGRFRSPRRRRPAPGRPCGS